MPINLEVNGVEYTNFTRATVSIAFDTLANDFAFQAVMPAGEKLPFKGGESCTVTVDGVLVLTGSIENIEGSFSSGMHNISIAGRDRTGDLIDSSVDVIDDLRGELTLKQIIEKVIAHIGSDLLVVDEANPKPFNKAEDIISPQPGDNAFEIIEEYAQKRQVLLSSNAEGNIVITNSTATPSGAVLQNALEATTNNILSASWSYSTTNLFNKYIQKGQLDPVALSFGESTSDNGVIAQDGEAIDSNIRAGRQLVMVSDKGFSQGQLQTRADWSKKIRTARSYPYACTSHSFKNSAGDVWALNTLVTVFDEFADIDRALLLNTATFSYGPEGSVSELGFVEENAYELLTTEPKPVGTNQDSFIL